MDDGLKEVRVSEYIYHSKGTPLCDVDGEISLPRSEIVRCKDCKLKRDSWNGKHPTFSDWFFCAYWGGYELTQLDGYCAWGIKKVEA
ncbi:MAG: hypothetical protein IIZ12_03005 [Eggerthellaceae bacterium]|nr:hypothetical protein [Eggerthellaceae bacterium]